MTEHSLVSYKIPSIQVQIKVNRRILEIFIDIVSRWLLSHVTPSTQTTTIHRITLFFYFEPSKSFFEYHANASAWETTSPLFVSFAVSTCIESSLSSSLSQRNHFVTSVYLRFFYRCQRPRNLRAFDDRFDIELLFSDVCDRGFSSTANFSQFCRTRVTFEFL